MNSRDDSKIVVLWRDLIKGAEDRCAVNLHQEIESYLVELLIRFTSQPDIAKEVMAISFLDAINEQEIARRFSLANVGDHCLLLSGLFPGLAERRQVKIRYFVDLGRSAYATISDKTTDIYSSLALQFVVLMDILQSVNENRTLLPMEAYELWQDVGSRRAFKTLQEYSKEGLPIAEILRI